MILAAGTRLGPFEILTPLGKGGMGEVYRAKDARLDRTVAIKILPANLTYHPTRSQRFQREARAASRLSHPHICALFDVGEHDGVHFLVMEYLEGESLSERLGRGALPINQVLSYAIEIADALDHAHRAGIVHRDLKPANIMLTRSGAKLLDFGVARLRESDPIDSVTSPVTESLTEEGSIPGTLQYVAPEQLEGHDADARTDIFALGAVIFEMATGRRAFEGATRASVMAAILERDPPPLSAAISQTGSRSANAQRTVPPLLEHVVARCLAKNPDERWQTAADVRQELKWIAEGGSQLRASAATPTESRWRDRRLILASAAVALVVAGFLAARQIDWSRAVTGPPTFKQITFRRGNLTKARFSPDSQTILYSAAWEGGPVQVFETRPNGPASKPIGPQSTGLESVSSSNELALIMGCRLDYGYCMGTLARMPLSGGAPREVLDNVVSADWTPDGRELAVIHLVQGESRLEFPIGKQLHAAAGKLQWLAFSPQGDRLAFIEHPILEDEGGVLKVVDLEGRTTTVSAGWKTIRGLHWSPKGDAIWLTGSQTGKTCSLFAVSLSGDVRLILHAPGDLTLYDVARDGRLLMSNNTSRGRMIWSKGGEQRDLSWLDWSTVADVSSDGKTVLFHEWGVGTGATPVVYARPTDGSDAVRLGDGKALALSPDGRWALALVDRAPLQLVLLPTGTGESRPLPSEGLTDVYWARWFPDGRRLLVVLTGADNVPGSHVLDVETGGLQPFADPGSLALLVSPDGKRVLVQDPLSGFDIWPTDGDQPVHLDGLLPEDRPIQWSADGRLLYVRGAEENMLRLYRYDIGTKRRELWRELAPGDLAGVVGVATGRGELAITPDGETVAFTYWVMLETLFLVEGVQP